MDRMKYHKSNQKIELNQDQKFIFFTGMQLAIKFKKLNFTEKQFIEFCKGLWESVEMNNLEELENTLQYSMKEDLENFLKDK